jgi:predicted Na+-dependent transporter
MEDDRTFVIAFFSAIIFIVAAIAFFINAFFQDLLWETSMNSALGLLFFLMGISLLYLVKNNMPE